jgi:hypothetical protein
VVAYAAKGEAHWFSSIFPPVIPSCFLGLLLKQKKRSESKKSIKMKADKSSHHTSKELLTHGERECMKPYLAGVVLLRLLPCSFPNSITKLRLFNPVTD